MAALIITVLLAAGISALCSTTEAMLYSVPWTYLEKMREKGSKAGQLMYNMRSNINQPITAVLTLNTVANTAGASIAGALAASALGAEYMPIFAVVFTILILVTGEILPKTFGVAYAEPLSMVLAYPLRFLIVLLRPITWASGFVTRLIRRPTPVRKPRKTTSGSWPACRAKPAASSSTKKPPSATSCPWIRSGWKTS